MTLPPDGAGVFCAPAQGLCALQPGKTFSVAQFACLSVCEHFFFTVHFLFPYLGKLLTRNRSQLAESAGVIAHELSFISNGITLRCELDLTQVVCRSGALLTFVLMLLIGLLCWEADAEHRIQSEQRRYLAAVRSALS